MRAKTFLAAGVLSLSLIGIASAKTWDIMMDSATRAGAITLPAGNYHVKLNNNNQALFTEADSGKKYTVPVTVNKAARKYNDTAVETKKQGDTNVMESIDLGGTMDRLQVGE